MEIFGTTVNAQYALVQFGCGANQPYGYASYVTGACYQVDSAASVIVKKISATQVEYQRYTNPNCQGTSSANPYIVGTCFLGQFRWSLTTTNSIYPANNIVYFQRYSYGGVCQDGPSTATFVTLPNRCSAGFDINLQPNGDILNVVNQASTSVMLEMHGGCANTTLQVMPQRSCSVPNAYSIFNAYYLSNWKLSITQFVPVTYMQATILVDFVPSGPIVPIKVEATTDVSGTLQYSVVCASINSGTACTINNLSPSQSIKFRATYLNPQSVLGDSMDPIESDYFTMPSAPIVSEINIISFTTSTITFNYSSIGGIPTSTTSYSFDIVSIDNDTTTPVNQPPTTSTTYTVTGLQANANYKINVYVSNGGIKSSALRSKQVQLYQRITSPSVQLVATTKTILVSFSVANGIPNATVYSVTFNGQPEPNCYPTLVGASSCLISNNILPNTQYVIKVVANNDNFDQTTTQSITTFKSISDPILNGKPLITTIELNFNISNGIDSLTTRSLFINGVLVPTLDSKTSTLLTNLNPSTNYNLTIVFNCEGFIQSLTKFYLTLDEPKKVEIISDNDLNTINLHWTSSNGGIVGETVYTPSISYDGVEWFDKCQETKQQSCLFDNLVQNTTYQFKVTTQNSGYTVVSDVFKTLTTLVNSTSSLCTISSGTSVQCSGNGHCVDAMCRCFDGFSGIYCEMTQVPIQNTTTIALDQTNPTVQVTIGSSYTYSLQLDSVVEMDTNNKLVSQPINLDRLTWSLQGPFSQPLNDNNNNNLVIKSWKYTSSNGQIVIEFIQLQSQSQSPLPSSTSAEIIFAGHTILLNLNQIKYSISFTNLQISSTEAVYLAVNSTISYPQLQSCSDSLTNIVFNQNQDSHQIAKYFTFSFGNNSSSSSSSTSATLTGRFVNRVNLLTLPTKIDSFVENDINSKTIKVSSIVPLANLQSQSIKSLMIDPEFDLTVFKPAICHQPSSSNSSDNEEQPKIKEEENNSTKMIIGIVVGVSGAIILATASVMMYKRGLFGKRNINQKKLVELNRL
ncbi:hypothetical protein DFA_05711 [Cavenderia fasciculata]|uniref:Fibronectin type-III domain-containing protein n=1 Tax=Cavenderia fasciculata TaxID=261658 RepID=F4PM78_CACFS|nr:uncharacterized protein DFA_05711 [Cavenderia fasciculata]EGG23578.1 hypothetical protein DFA_05711 [Cavenderia fasciculata]|eukprot:XP_004361429.1 hypothetical protein DFA_05711 [Cavenderia fasciculata]